MEETLRQFFKAVGAEARLKVLGALVNGPVTHDELMRTTGLKASDLPRHTHYLRTVGLVEGGPVYRMNPAALREMSKQVLQEVPAEVSPAETKDERWERKVLKDMIDSEQRLRRLPSNWDTWQVILRWLVAFFETDRRYREIEVNEVIKAHHPDFATLRRYLVDCKYMQRENGIYWRLS